MIRKHMPPPSPLRVILVDDDRRLLKAINLRLIERGFQSVCFDNVYEALAHFAVHPIDLIITDLSMPGIDGLGLISMIRRQSDIPIIVITAQTAGPEKFAGFDHVNIIHKPFEFSDLVGIAFAAIGGSRCAPPVPAANSV